MSAYKSTVIQTVHYVEVPFIVARTESEQFKQKVSNWLGLAVNTHVFDFKNVEKIDDSFSDNFQIFKTAAQAKNCSVISVNFRPKVLEGIKRKGHEKIFGYVSSFDSIASTAPRDTAAETRNWVIKYLVAASRDAMNIMFNTTVAADENYRESVKDFGPEKFHRVAFVGIKSAKFTADLRLYFEKSVLSQLATLSLGGNAALIDDEVIDSTATELLNLIYGSAKSKINDARGYNLPNAIPTLITAAQVAETRSKDPKRVAIIPFVTPIGAYYLEVDLGAE